MTQKQTYLSIKQIADWSAKSPVYDTYTKSGIRHIVNKTPDIQKHIIESKPRNTKLIDEQGVHLITKQMRRSKNYTQHLSSTLSLDIVRRENQRLEAENERLHNELEAEQKIALSAQSEAKQLRLNPPKKHSWVWKLFH